MSISFSETKATKIIILGFIMQSHLIKGKKKHKCARYAYFFFFLITFGWISRNQMKIITFFIIYMHRISKKCENYRRT